LALAPNTGYGLLNPGTTTPPAPAPTPSSPYSPPINPSTGTVDYTGWGAGSPTGAQRIDPSADTPGYIPPDAVDLGGGTFWSGSQGMFNVPPPTQSAQPPTGGGAGGFSNASDYLNWDPAYQQAIAMEQQGFGQLDAQMKAQRERAIINFGDPALASQAGFGLDPQAAAFAQQNYLSGNSTMSRLDRAHQLAAQAVINQLAAHGLLNSGDLGYKEGLENQTYGNNVYDARQSVLDALSGLYGNYLSGRQGYEEAVNRAMSDALNRWLQNPDFFYGSAPPSRGGAGSGGSGSSATGAPKTSPTTYSSGRKPVRGPSIFAFK
jgi:hypothetical protein